MADSKITGLTADAAPTSDDLVVTVNDPLGTPANRKVTLANLALGIGGAWTAWTPTWVNLTIGNGTNDWKYMQIGKSVWFRGVTIFGTTTTMGTGPTFTLPVTSIAVPHTNMQIATLKLYNGGGNFNGEVNWATTTTGLLQTWDVNNNTSPVNATSPGTWANGWGIFAQGFYEAA